MVEMSQIFSICISKTVIYLSDLRSLLVFFLLVLLEQLHDDFGRGLFGQVRETGQKWNCRNALFTSFAFPAAVGDRKMAAFGYTSVYFLLEIYVN